MCRLCRAKGLIVPAVCVDHIVAHHGDLRLFLDPKNLQALCRPCHDQKSALERGCKPRVWIGVDGWPIDEPTWARERSMAKN
jgi:5-methylcytosine-specific restriction endonuclease McrA